MLVWFCFMASVNFVAFCFPTPLSLAVCCRWAAVSKRVATQAEEVYVYLPRFKMDFRASLKQPLREMGVDLAFTRNADFSGISRSTPLLISDVIQRAVIEVNEEGTEAAAATAVVMNRAMVRNATRTAPNLRQKVFS